MKNFFKAIAASFSKDEPARQVNDIQDLKQGDFLTVEDSMVLPSEIRGQTFELASIDSYFYGQELCTEWALKGPSSRKMFFSIGESDDEETAVFSFKLKRKEVEALFGWDELSKQYSPDFKAPLVCKDADAIPGWLSTSYLRRECAGKGMYFTGDYRGKTKPNDGEPLTYYEFFSEDETHSLEVEQWSPEEIEVFIALHRPLTDVKEFWAK